LPAPGARVNPPKSCSQPHREATSRRRQARCTLHSYTNTSTAQPSLHEQTQATAGNNRPTAALRHSTSERQPCAACCCGAALDRLTVRRALRLGQLRAVRRHTAASRHPTSERHALRRCVAALGCLAACRAWRLVQLRATRRPKAPLRHSTSEHRVLRSAQLAAASRPLVVSLRTERGAWYSSVLPGGPQPPRAPPPRSAVQLAAGSQSLAVSRRAERRI